MAITGESGVVLRPYQRRWVADPARLAVAVKAAQVGYSTATAAMAVADCFERAGALWVLLSRSDRQSRELAEKCKTWVTGYDGAAVDMSDGAFEGTSVTQHEIRFGNGSRIIALPANPDTARGYTGHVVLDEFAFHQGITAAGGDEAIFRAVYRQTTLGYKLRVMSTPNGQRGKFFELARALGLDLGVRPERQPVRSGAWSGHWCDLALAAEEGAPLDEAEIRAGCDAETFEQEYGCRFLSTLSEWISAEALDGVLDSAASAHFDGNAAPLSLVAGWDVARKVDLSVVWLSETVGDVSWTRGVIEMSRLTVPAQIQRARDLMPFIRRMNVDPSGAGLAVVETLAREFPGRVSGVQFYQQNKERLAVLAKRRIEEQKVRVPDTPAIRHAFRAVRRRTNALGQASFDAVRDARYGHADHFWAFALAEAAAESRGRELGLVDMIKAEGAKRLAKPVFGSGAESCRACGSKLVAAVGTERRCGSCGLQWGSPPPVVQPRGQRELRA